MIGADKPVLRVGILGGAFDPPHQAHVALGGAAIEQLRLDVLRVIPTGQAWHKSRRLTAATHRLAMVHLAFADCRNAVVDAREIQRTGPSYTVDTLEELHAECAPAQFFLLMGADQARRLPTWHRWQRLLELATICVADRPDDTRPQAKNRSDEWAPGCHHRLHMTPIAVSATQIRAQCAQGNDVTPLVNPAVARYIADHHLYQET